jgi:hypothetical protein
MSLRDVFMSLVRDYAYSELKRGLLRDWRPELVYNVIDEALSEKIYEINSFLESYVVTLENMNPAALRVAREILIPYISKKRVQ